METSQENIKTWNKAKNNLIYFLKTCKESKEILLEEFPHIIQDKRIFQEETYKIVKTPICLMK